MTTEESELVMDVPPRNRKRILVISPCVPPYPIAEGDHAFLTCKHLARNGFQVTLLTAAVEEYLEGGTFEILPVMKSWSWRGLPTLIRTIRTTRPDYVYLFFLGFLFNYKIMVTFLPQYLTIFSRRTKFAVLFTDLGNARGLGWLLRGVSRLAGKFRYGTLLTSAHTILYLSARHHQKIVDLCPAADRRMAWIPVPPLISFPDLSREASRVAGRELLGLGSNDVLVSYFGRVYPGKGLETLLDAFSKLVKITNHIRLLIIGGFLPSDAWSSGGANYGRELRDLIQAHGIGGRVRWSGEFSLESDTASLQLSASDVCVLPFDDGVAMSNSSLAAASAHGLPIVTTKRGVLEAPLSDGENGLFCPPQDPDAMAAEMLRVISDSDLRERLRVGALALYREHFSWDLAIKTMIGSFPAR